MEASAGLVAAGGGSAPSRHEERLRLRVALSHRQARSGLRIAGAFAAAAVLSLLVGGERSEWRLVHLLLVGSGVSVVSAVAPLLAVTWSTAPARSPSAAAVQRWLVAVGTVALVVGLASGHDTVAVSGAVAVGAAVVLLAVSLVVVALDASTPRFRPAIAGYATACAFAVVGISGGVAMVVGVPARWYDHVRAAHVVLNVFGFLGLVIVATLPYFAATQLRMKMSPAATPAAVSRLVAGAAAAVAVGGVGALCGSGPAVAVGMGLYAVVLLESVRLAPSPGRKQLRWAGPRIAQLGAGLVWWLAGTVWVAIASVGGTVVPEGAVVAVLLGGYGQIVAASLAYVVPVVLAEGHGALATGFATMASWPALVLAQVAIVAALAGSTTLAWVAGGLWLGDLGLRAARVAVAADRARRGSVANVDGG
jgi:nitrite reductase (NO-forming)